MAAFKLVTNSVDTENVDERTIDGDRHLIARDVRFIQAMNLAGGYVPSRHVANSAPKWDGVPLTVNHPRNDAGQVVSADSEIGQQVTVGRARNPSANADGSLTADLLVNADVAEAMGGEAAEIVRALETGEPLEVSSQYFAESLEPGVYDGQHRANAEGHLEPDSIALLPNKEGVCSLEDGCGVGAEGQAVANAADGLRVPVTDDPAGARSPGSDSVRANVSVGGITFDDTGDGDLDEAEIPNDDFEPHYVFDGETKSGSSFPLVDADGTLRRQNVAAAFRFRDDAPDTDELLSLLEDLNDRFDDPPIDPESLEDAMTSNSDVGLVGNVLSFLGFDTGREEQQSDERAESREDPPSDDGTSTMQDRDKLIDEITSNSAITASSLADACDERVKHIHEDVVSNTDDDAGDDDDDGTDTADGDDSSPFDQVMDRLDSLESQMVTEDDVKELAANAQEEQTKDQLASKIVANSSEYDDADVVLEDFPTTEALEIKADQITMDGTIMPGSGTTANADVGDLHDEDDVDDDLGSGVLAE